jgi:hypothetical protein
LEVEYTLEIISIWKAYLGNLSVDETHREKSCYVASEFTFSIQSCRSYYAYHLCQRPFYKIFVKFRNSRKMYLKLF